MKQYKEIENDIEYDVFELNDCEIYIERKELERYEHCKIIKAYDDCIDIYYLKYGEPHNEWGPSAVRIGGTLDRGWLFWNQYEDCGPYYIDGCKLEDEEWKCFHRTKMIDEMLNNCNECKRFYV